MLFSPMLPAKVELNCSAMLMLSHAKTKLSNAKQFYYMGVSIPSKKASLATRI